MSHSQIDEAEFARIVIETCNCVDQRWHDGEDTAALVFFALKRRIENHPQLKNPHGWVVVSARRESKLIHRRFMQKRKRRKEISLDQLPDEVMDWEEKSHEYGERLTPLWTHLPSSEQRLISAKLRINGETSLANVATETGVTRQAASKKASASLAKLRKALEAQSHVL